MCGAINVAEQSSVYFPAIVLFSNWPLGKKKAKQTLGLFIAETFERTSCLRQAEMSAVVTNDVGEIPNTVF